MRPTHIIIAAMAVVFAAGCCPCRKGGARAEQAEFLGTQWKMTQFEGRAFQAGDNYRIRFGEDGKVNGKGDCNTLAASFTTTDNGKLAIDKMAGTRMFCRDQQTEDRFMKMVSAVESYKIDGRLLLFYTNSELVAAFEAEAEK